MAFGEVVASYFSTKVWMRTWITMVKEVMPRLWQLLHRIQSIQVTITHASEKMFFYCSFAVCCFYLFVCLFFKNDSIWFCCIMSIQSSMSNNNDTNNASCLCSLLFAKTVQKFILISSQPQFALWRTCEPGHGLKTGKSSSICTTNEAL